ncbi:DNA primase [Haloimpatiens sp. FM7315]|uniref:DNA primase n=1 Tax=Haloimpatiens sp. FM7315 TaxID=3298609 RepID=UPI00370AA5E7
MISEDLILKIKEENDIVDVISEVMTLKRAGRNYVGLCPFHGEKTPSFTVSKDKQIFKCFGCGEAGNVITFIMKYKRFNFPEAVKFLGERVNIDVEEDKAYELKNSKKNKLYKINVEAAKYFFNNLTKNSVARNYFFKRGMDKKTLVRFGLGYAVDDWNSLMNYLKNRGYTALDMLEAGLIIKGKNNSYYDRFRNRVMFPVFDYKGRVIGFGGRVLNDSKPKYLNSPETELFKKGTNLYGLNFVIDHFKTDTIVIVEGYMDLISLNQSGIVNVVASLGTALTTQQAKLLKRYVKKIIISYDADTAGQLATLRGMEILKKEGFDVRVLMIPEDKDPDEFVRNHGSKAFESLIEKALPLTEYRIFMESKGINLSDKEMIIKYTRKIIPILLELDPVERELYIKRVAEISKINEQVLYDMVARYAHRGNDYSSNSNKLDDVNMKLYMEPASVKAERVLLNTMLKHNSSIEYIRDKIKVEDMDMNIHKFIYKTILENKSLPKDELKRFIEVKCTDIESSKEFVKILDTEVIDENNCSVAINDCVAQIKKSRLEESKKAIMEKIKKYEAEGKFDETIKLASELVDIQKKISKEIPMEGGNR